MKKASFIFFVLFSLCAITCKKNPITPSLNGYDTTSHNFTWQKFTFGYAGASQLNDVAIINDTLAYAVGEIYLTDSTGQYDPLPYNLAIWNGTNWDVKRVTVNFRGNLITPPLYGIFAFSGSQILLAGGMAIYGDGIQWIPYDVRLLTGFDTLLTERCWGSSPTNMYFVGLHGTLVHFDGNSWTRINSGTTLDIFDIWGAQNSHGQWEVLAIATSSATDNNMLLQIQPNNTVLSLSTNGLAPFSTGIWFVPEEKYYIVGSGIFQKSTLNESNWIVYPPGVVTSYASSTVYGQGLNDVFVSGSFLEVVHYNGSTWYNYKNEIPAANGALGGIALKGNTAVLVGYIDQQAVAFIGRR